MDKKYLEYIEQAEYDIAEFISNRIATLAIQIRKPVVAINTTIYNNRDESDRDYGWIAKKASITFDKVPHRWIEN